MQIQYLCPFWGCEQDDAQVFINKVVKEGFEGIEINPPLTDSAFTKTFMAGLDEVRSHNKDFVFVLQQLTSPDHESVDRYIQKMENSILELSALQPNFINSHTGKDCFSFDDNCKVIEAALNISAKTGIRILHETHRGRFSFHASTLLPYLKRFPELELIADFSHFCTVSESLLQDQEAIIHQIIPHVSHIHARVGHEQGPQVNDPAAPEWQHHFNHFAGWWQQIIALNADSDQEKFTITPEHGPFPYMPQAPYTQQPLSNQWNTNVYIMNRLKNMLA